MAFLFGVTRSLVSSVWNIIPTGAIRRTDGTYIKHSGKYLRQ